MKIIHYIIGLPSFRGGGLMQYAIDLMEEEVRLGHEVIAIWPGGKRKYVNGSKIIDSEMIGKIKTYEILNTPPIPLTGITQVEPYMQLGDYKLFREFIEKISPNIVHVHSLMGLPYNFLKVVCDCKIASVFTTHDYFGLCPKTNLFHQGKNCHDYMWEECQNCCQGTGNFIDRILEQSILLQKIYKSSLISYVVKNKALIRTAIWLNSMLTQRKQSQSTKETKTRQEEYKRLQQYYREMFAMFDIIHCNSEQTYEIFEKRLGNHNYIVKAISHQYMTDQRKKKNFQGKHLQLTFLGNLQEIKGFFMLKKCLDNLYNSGKCDFSLKVFFNTIQEDSVYIKYCKPYKINELERILKDTDIVVVPSLWQETFGLVVLESICFGVPCIMTDSVGAKMVIPNELKDDLIVKTNIESLQGKIEEYYDNRDKLQKVNEKIIDWKMEIDFTKHVKEMIEVYQEIIVLHNV